MRFPIHRSIFLVIWGGGVRRGGGRQCRTKLFCQIILFQAALDVFAHGSVLFGELGDQRESHRLEGSPLTKRQTHMFSPVSRACFCSGVLHAENRGTLPVLSLLAGWSIRSSFYSHHQLCMAPWRKFTDVATRGDWTHKLSFTYPRRIDLLI